MKHRLPIEDCLPELMCQLQATNRVILTAPPGAGKTTLVPVNLLSQPWLAAKKIILLEPRRIAARLAAARLALQLGEKLGERVGFQVRGERMGSSATKLLVVTEGVLTRMLQSDPELPEVGLVIFDEFHERSIHADLGLALVLQSQSLIRSDLRLLIMSATLDAQAVSDLLGDAPVVRSEGRQFDVQTYYRSAGHSIKQWNKAFAEHCGTVCCEALTKHQGDMLVFLPGRREIVFLHSWLTAQLHERIAQKQLVVLSLYGNQPLQEQQAVIKNTHGHIQRIILSTNIAQTSLTIDGVNIVVDTGLVRVSRFDPASGFDRMSTIAISRDAADQRRGRAGRVRDGVCYRLWSETEQQRLMANTEPEILQSDLSSLCLELAVWGVTEPAELCWMNIPPKPAIEVSRQLLMELGAVDMSGQVTEHGRLLAALPVHVRFANMLLSAGSLGFTKQALLLAAMLEERDIFKQASSIDVSVRIEYLMQTAELNLDGRSSSNSLSKSTALNKSVDKHRVKAVLSRSRTLRKQLESHPNLLPINTRKVKKIDPDYAVGALLALAFPDRVAAQQHRDGRYIMAGGKSCVVDSIDALSREPWLSLADVDHSRATAKAWSAASITQEIIRDLFKERIEKRNSLEWDEPTERIVSSRIETFGSIVLSTKPATQVDSESIDQLMVLMIRKKGLRVLPLSKKHQRLLDRVKFLNSVMQKNSTVSKHLESIELPDFSDVGLLANLETWLQPYLQGRTRLSALAQLDMGAIILSELSWDVQQRLNELVPTSVKVPSGSDIQIDYTDAQYPVLAVRMQEMFGASETPRIVMGQVPLQLHLLSPAQRPLQVTQDLGGFWKNSYAQVRKEMRSRYQKHYWPEDPEVAQATTRTKRAMKQPDGGDRK